MHSYDEIDVELRHLEARGYCVGADIRHGQLIIALVDRGGDSRILIAPLGAPALLLGALRGIDDPGR